MNKKQILLTVCLPIFLSILVGIIIIILSNSQIINSRATAIISKEKSEMNNGISKMISEIKTLEADIAEYDAILKEKEKAVSEIEYLNNELNAYTSDIQSVMDKISEADTKIEEKTKYLQNITELTPETPGEKKTFKSGEYKSPAHIKPGRYLAEGSGTIYLYAISNSLRLKENLSSISSHSYTFEINSGETLKVDGNVSITELTK